MNTRWPLICTPLAVFATCQTIGALLVSCQIEECVTIFCSNTFSGPRCMSISLLHIVTVLYKSITVVFKILF